MVYGDGRPFNVCLVVPDPVMLGDHASHNGHFDDPVHLLDDAEERHRLAGEITAFLEGKFGGYEIPKKFVWLEADFSLEAGTLTQTMKLKRRVVLEQHLDQLQALYA